MATPVEAPKLGNSVEECLISRWVKQKGETVSAGDVVAEIETDKATFEVTSPVDGVLLESFFDEGALVPVFTNIFVIGARGRVAEAFRPGAEVAAAPESVEHVGLPADDQARADDEDRLATTGRTESAGAAIRAGAQLPSGGGQRVGAGRAHPRSRTCGNLYQSGRRAFRRCGRRSRGACGSRWRPRRSTR